ncbi:hypothetical protein BRADI_2g18620v3 [Brachypodium distachyon]|uniref:Hydrophobic seed protein domain-containing protein n=1 Tax=Brachypodium distachyon TaxID=15368 RepID=I1HH65_BRADI|nr:hypothetical protein BRADI_2g18620v3 [Brachypodium distachyon]
MASKAMASSAHILLLAAAALLQPLAMSSTAVKAQQCTSDLDGFLACGDFRNVPAAQKTPVDREKCCRLVSGTSSQNAADCLCANFARGITDDNDQLNFIVGTVLEVCDKDPVSNLDCSSRST